MIKYTEIIDFEAPELDVYARLTEAQLLNRFEPKKGMFIAESPKVIMRALDAGCVPVSLLVERGHVNEEAAEAIERCGDKYFIPCITQGGPGSLYEGTYAGIWEAIDEYNCKTFGFTKEQLDEQRPPMAVMF